MTASVKLTELCTRVGALADELGDDVAGIVDDVGVVAEAAAHDSRRRRRR